MRLKHAGLGVGVAGGTARGAASALAFLLLTTLLLTAPAVVKSEEQDFDDGVVEDLQEEAVDLQDEGFVDQVYESPKYEPEKFYFVDHFDNVDESRQLWVKSQAKKDDIAEEIAKYDGKWSWEAPQRIVSKSDIGLVLKSKAKHAAIAARLSKPFTFKEDKPLVVQYEVTMQDGQECGGSYIKLLSAGKETDDLTKFNDKTPYTIMFGPDKCGNDVKMHFIFRHVNPINGSISEKHCRKPKDRLEEPFKDKLPHLYHLAVFPDNTFEIRVDHKVINTGSLLTEFTPPVNPPREIDDPTDQKPQDWDEREKIPDPTAHKPEDWDDDAPPQIPDPTALKPDGWLEDEPEMIPDPSAQKPNDWDTEIDGEWEAPLVDNPICENAPGCGTWKAPLIANKEYKGKWRAPLIENPNYQGKWAARKIPNPDYFQDLSPFSMVPISAIGIELWSMSSDLLFDNLIITDDVEVANEFAANSFDLKRKFIDKESESFLNKLIAYATENPWAWRIAIVLIGTPLAFSLYRLFSKGDKQPSKGDASDSEDAKKTDALQPDDPSTEDATSTQKQTAPSPKVKKSDLNVKEDEVVGNKPSAKGGASNKVQELNDVKLEDTVDEEEAANNEKQKTKGEEETEERDSESEESSVKPVTARKRRVRKDNQS